MMMKPFASTAGMNTPTTVPMMEPRPPASAVPPSTTAVIASSGSLAWPSSVVVENRPSDSIAANPASSPLSAYSRSRWPDTLIPARRDASGLEPTRYVCRPNRVMCSTMPPASATSAVMTTSHGTPATDPCPSAISASGTVRMSLPSDSR